MSIDVHQLIATRAELQLCCRAWSPPRWFARPKKVRGKNPFLGKRASVLMRYEAPTTFDPAFSQLPDLPGSFLCGAYLGRFPGFQNALLLLANALREPGTPEHDELDPALLGPGSAIEVFPPHLASLLATDEGLARARAASRDVGHDPTFVDELAEDARLAASVGRELFLFASTDGSDETWAELVATLERDAPHRLGGAPGATLRRMATCPGDVLDDTSPEALATALLDVSIAAHRDRLLRLMAASSVDAPAFAPVLATMVEALASTEDPHVRAAVLQTFPSMAQVIGKGDASAALRVLRARPDEIALSRAVVAREIASPHVGVDTSALVRGLVELDPSSARVALGGFVKRRGAEGGAASIDAAEHLLATTSSPIEDDWLDAMLRCQHADRIARAFAKLGPEGARARLARAFASATDRARAHVLASALLHTWFGGAGFHDAPAEGAPAVLVTRDGFPRTTQTSMSSLVGERMRAVTGALVVEKVDGGFDDLRFAALQPPRRAASLTSAERAVLVAIHDADLLWDQRLDVLRAYGLPPTRRALGRLLGVPTPLRTLTVAPPQPGAPVHLYAHVDVGPRELAILHAVRDFLDVAFSAPVVVFRAPPAVAAPPASSTVDVVDLDRLAGATPIARVGRGIFVCAGPGRTYRRTRFGFFENGYGAFSLSAIRGDSPESELLGRALRVLGQVALGLFGYPLCPDDDCLLTAVPWRRPRPPGTPEGFRNAIFGEMPDPGVAPLHLCPDCLSVAAAHAGRSPEAHATLVHEWVQARVGTAAAG